MSLSLLPLSDSAVVDLPPNARRLLLELMTNGPTHRADLARVLGVSRTTITNLTTTLIEDGLLEVINTDLSQLKRPVAITPQLGTLVSLAFFVDTCTLAISTLDGRLLAQESLGIDAALTALERLDKAMELVRATYRLLGLELASVCGIHLALDTQINTHTGDIHARHASVRWYGVNPLKYLRAIFPVPIILENSIRLSGLAEALSGAGRCFQDVLYLSVRDGATSAHIRNGEIVSGSHGGAGEFGHVVYQWDGPLCACGNRGCAMQYMCIPALVANYHRRTDQEVDWLLFLQLVEAGDQVAVDIAQDAAVVCARTLINVAHVLDPGVVIINQAGVARLPNFITEVGDYVSAHALPLVGRHLQVIGSSLPDVVEATARTGIHPLRQSPQVQAMFKK